MLSAAWAQQLVAKGRWSSFDRVRMAEEGKNAITGSSYAGGISMGRFNGRGEFDFPDGTKYIGEFYDGMFHGHGKILTKDGVYSSQWEEGKEIPGKGKFTFGDDLDYAEKRWSYGSAADRRFNSEALGEGPKPAGETQLVDKPPCFRLPLDCYDTGDGYFDPEAGKVFAYDETDKDGERVVVREPTSTEVDWIKSKCRVGTL